LYNIVKQASSGSDIVQLANIVKLNIVQYCRARGL